MAHVTLTAALARFTGGQTEFEMDNVSTIRQLFRALSERFPDIKPHLEDGIAVAIDGQLFQDSLLEPIQPDSEVHLLPQIGGG
ncbi:MAG: MoaD/ThiS family protein [Rickettsiales bacterium]|jgi:molybdopterin synthase sulfur carrier subunit